MLLKGKNEQEFVYIVFCLDVQMRRLCAQQKRIRNERRTLRRKLTSAAIVQTIEFILPHTSKMKYLNDTASTSASASQAQQQQLDVNVTKGTIYEVAGK